MSGPRPSGLDPLTYSGRSVDGALREAERRWNVLHDTGHEFGPADGLPPCVAESLRVALYRYPDGRELAVRTHAGRRWAVEVTPAGNG